MPPLEDGQTAPSVGIIYPPPEVRNIVDKTATFVARNGPEFEQRIKQQEVNNPKFYFLSPGDPYHAYYQHRVNEIREGRPDDAQAAQQQQQHDQRKKVAEEEGKAPGRVDKPQGTTDEMKKRQSELLKQAQKDQEPPPPKDPPPEPEFLADPPSISAFDLDVVKLTAQFVARNGRQFLTNLMNREQRNYQFDFLRPQHSLFQYFTKLLEQYTKVLIPPKDLMRKLNEESESDKAIKEAVAYRVRWIKHVEAKRKKEEEEAERERVSYAQIDWHNFVVVETVDYQQWEVGNFPPPTNPGEVGARVLMQRRVEANPPPPAASAGKSKDGEGVEGESNMQVEDMDEDSSEEDEMSGAEDEEDASGKDQPTPAGKPLMAVDAAPAVIQPALPTPGNVEVRKYDPKQAKATKKAPDQEFISPLTGEAIPANKVQEHMRIGLLDPRWVEERDKQITARATEDAVYAPGGSIESSLKHLAERRTDIFGVGEEGAQEAAIGKKMGEGGERQAGQYEEEDEGPPPSSAAPPPQQGPPPSQQQQAPPQGGGASGIPEHIRIANEQRKRQQEAAAAAAAAEQQRQQQQQQMAPPPVQPPIQQVLIPRPAPPPPVVPMMPPVVPAPPPPQQFYMPPQHPPQFVPPPQQQQPPMAPPPGQPQPPMMPPQMDADEPPNKRPRGQEEHLMPEEIFLSRNPSPVTFSVICPVVPDKPEWRCSGQRIQLTLGLTDTVSTVKTMLSEETGMPPGKQKLQLESMFLKDANSLAYYNMRPGMAIGLQVKERGGRKK